MSPILSKKKSVPSVEEKTTEFIGGGWRFTLKGSPRHYDDVKQIIESSGSSQVYFGEALAYERGAGVALWRVEARDFSWLPKLYSWWAEMERLEPINFTFNLYIPPQLKYAALDLRNHTAAEVEAYIKEHAPQTQAGAVR
jgi:hypothetical protein